MNSLTPASPTVNLARDSVSGSAKDSAADPAQFKPQSTPLADPKAAMQERMARNGQWLPQQTAGRRWGVACVSLEITQRCNLDCTLCYLSESSEAVQDFPMEEIDRRIDMIVAHYGPGTDVQVSGGEPTLRARGELVAIVRRLASKGLRPSLFTNGIKATRDLLAELAVAGLVDVAFHVDITQERKGYVTEADLNALRLEYINRARGLPISVFFNTTVHAANFDDVPMLTAFFVAHADVVRFSSFQLQAETGRGVLGARTEPITNDSLARRLQQGVDAPLQFNVLLAGHHDCNRSAVVLVANGRAYDAFEDAEFIRRFMRETAHLCIDRGTPWRAARSLASSALAQPALAWATLRFVAAQAWRMKRDLIAARGRVHKLTLFSHNFMDACALDAGRVDACVFMAMTQDGPLSMCAYNAQRDQYLLKPLPTRAGLWQPLRAGHAGSDGKTDLPSVPIKWLKGRPRALALQQRLGGAAHAGAGANARGPSAAHAMPHVASSDASAATATRD
jgi:7,8-dihydro-6-hydroxymethylpterin dimethyltransferase